MKLLIVLLAIGLPSIFCIKVEKCSGGGAIPADVRVAGCDALPCNLQNGDDFSFEMDFAPDRDITELAVVVKAFGPLGITIPYELPAGKEDGCTGMVGGCPLTADETVVYGLDVPINAPVTGIDATLQFTMSDSKGPVICFRAKTHINKG